MILPNASDNDSSYGTKEDNYFASIIKYKDVTFFTNLTLHAMFSLVDLGEVILLQSQQIMLTSREKYCLEHKTICLWVCRDADAIIYLSFGMQRCLWWKETSVRGVAKHGQGFVETLDTVTASAGFGRVHNMELVTPNFQDLLASVTSHVEQASTTKVILK